MKRQNGVLQGSGRKAPSAAKTLGPVDPNTRFDVTVVLRRRAELPRPLVEGPDTVSSDVFADQYGAAAGDIETVQMVLYAAGLSVSKVHPHSRRLTVSGTAAAFSAIFGTQLVQVRSQDLTGREVEHRSRVGELQIPYALREIVVAVLGLDDRPQAKTSVLSAPDLAPAQQIAYDPPTLAEVYGFPPDADGSGQVAAIIELGGGFRQPDLDTYFASLNLPSPTVRAIGVNGAQNNPGPDPSSDGEVQLDIEILGALAPGAEMKVYFAPNDDRGFLDSLSAAIHDTPTPTVVSISWGASENLWTTQTTTAMDEVFADAAALGVTVIAAAGDDGSSDGQTDGSVHLCFPASSPHALAAGGTSLHLHATGEVDSETVWNNPRTGAATGGGVSEIFSMPSWQSNAGVPTRFGHNTPGRGIPDVAAVADPRTGYRVRINGKDLGVGGTSATTPLWAALVCRLSQSLNRKLGLLHPTLYAATQPGVLTPGFREILSGSNGVYEASAGWDPCTGLGVPDGLKLLSVLSAPADCPTKP